MRGKFSKISSVILLVVFAFFFASTNFFLHTHDGPYGKIIHSHPWSGKTHDHTGTQVQLIGHLSMSLYDVSSVLDHVEESDTKTVVLEFREIENSLLSHLIDTDCRRGPPVLA